MQDNDFPEVVKALTALSEVLGKELSEMMFKIYFNALKELTIDQVKRACALSVKKHKFFPKPVELIELVTGDDKCEAIVAYDRVKETIGTHGAYRSIVFDDPAIHATLESLGGWVAVCEREPDEWLRKEFCTTYEAHTKRLRAGDFRCVPLKMVGRCEGHNNLKGHATPVSFIGNQAKAQAWLAMAKATEAKTGLLPAVTGETFSLPDLRLKS